MTVNRKAWSGTLSTALVALAGYVAWLTLRSGTPWLVPAVTCPGLLDLAAITAARVSPDTRVGVWLVWLNGLLIVPFVFVLVRLMLRAGASWPVAAAIGIAIPLLPSFDPVLSPLDPAALVVAGATCLAFVAATPEGPSRPPIRAWRPWLGLLVTALVAPRLTVPLAILAALAMPSSRPWASPLRWVSALVFAGIVAGMLALVPPLPVVLPGSTRQACLVPAIAGDAGLGSIASAATSAGAFGLGLAALGAFTVARRTPTQSAGLLILYLIAAAVSRASGDGLFIRQAAPILVVLWVSMAIGLEEMVRACRPGRAGRIAAGIVVAVFPLLQLAGAVARPHTTDDRGHRRLALQGFRQLVGVIPNDGVLVEEDALTTLLLRARAARWPNAGRSPRFVGRDATVVGRLAGDPGLRIYALPEAHAYLQMRGFEMGDVKAPGLSGLAEVRRIGGCAGPDARWRELPDLQRSPRMALVAIDAGTDATAIVYVGAHERPAPLALDWPRVMLRGFEPRTYELSKDDERARFMGDTKSDGLTEPPSLASFAFVTRLSLRHIPGAPIVLPVGFGLRPGVVAARLAAGDHGSLSLCPAFPGTPPSIAVP